MAPPLYTIRRKPRHKIDWQVHRADSKPTLICECGGKGTAQVIADQLTAYEVRLKGHCCQKPHVSINASFVSYGYQIDTLVNGEPVSVACRDFGDDHKITDLIESFIKHAEDAIEAFRSGK